MTKTELKTAIIKFKSLTTMQVAAKFSINELIDIKTHLDEQLKTLLIENITNNIDGKNNAKTNTKLSGAINLIKKANNAIVMIQGNEAELKQSKNDQDQIFLTEFHAMVQMHLSRVIYSELKRKALDMVKIRKMTV